MKSELTILARKLLGMLGTVRHFAEHKSDILRTAVESYRELAGSDDSIPEDEIRQLVEGLYETTKETSIQEAEIPFELHTGDHITITTDGVKVEGEVEVSPKTLSVIILSPFKGRRATTELKMIVPAIWTVAPEDGSEANEAGKRKAAALLCDLYYSFFEGQ